MPATETEALDPPASEKTPQASSPPRSWARVLIAVLVVGAIVAVARYGGGSLPQFAQWVDGLGFWGPLVYIVGYAVATVAFIPGSLLTMAGGVIFGLFEGTAIVFVGATLGACAAFLVSRYVARGAVEHKVATHPRFAAIDKAVAQEGLKIIFLLRLSPVFPFVLLNYALGLTKVRFWHYALASLGMIPGTFLYVYYGKLAGDLTTLASGGGGEKNAGYYVVWAVGLGATLVVTWVVTRLARRALREVASADDKRETSRGPEGSGAREEVTS